MEIRNDFPRAWVEVDRCEIIVDSAGRGQFWLKPKGAAAEHGNIFVIDIYSMDDSSHPKGHVGWWEWQLGHDEEYEVQITLDDGKIAVSLGGLEPENFWVNEEFSCKDHILVVRLIVREWKTRASLFEDPILVYPGSLKKLKDKRHDRIVVPKEQLPLSWFVWPEKYSLILAFDSLKHNPSRNLLEQIIAILRYNDIPYKIYAHEYDGADRSCLWPVEYLLDDKENDDPILYFFSGNGEVLRFIASLPHAKFAYGMYLPDWRRIQVYDAQYARKLREAEESLKYFLAFDGICYESETVHAEIEKSLKNISETYVRKNWGSFALIGEEVINTARTDRERKATYLDIKSDIHCFAHSLGPEDYEWQKKLLLWPKVEIPETFAVVPPILWRENWAEVEEIACEVPDKFILSVGSFRPDKNYEETLGIFAELAKANKDIALVIAGWAQIMGYWEYINFLRTCKYADLAEKIIFMQNCSKGRIKWLYNRAKLFFTAANYEVPNGPISDALEFNLPIMAKSSDSVREMLGRSGIYYTTGASNSDISKYMEKIFEEEKIRVQVLEGQKLSAAKKTYRDYGQEILSVFEMTI